MAGNRLALRARALAVSTARSFFGAVVTSVSSRWCVIWRDLRHGIIERRAVSGGWPGRAADLPHELQRRRVDLVLRGRRLVVVQWSDVAAHDPSLTCRHAARHLIVIARRARRASGA